MNEKKIEKGVYYSCEHQQLGKSNCSTCVNDREREREREREQIKRW